MFRCSPDGLHRGTIRTQFVSNDDVWRPVPFHRFLPEFKGRSLILALDDIAFQHLTFVINRTLKVMLLALNLHENFVMMPSPVRVTTRPIDPFSTDLRCEHRGKSVPPETDSFVVDINASLVRHDFHISQRN